MNKENKNAEILSVYSIWVKKICAENNIRLDGELTSVKDDKVFCISSDIGELYFKKMTSFINDELDFTLKLMESGIIDLPEWIGYDHNMKVCLMRDMGGTDLSLLPSMALDLETSINMFISLSSMQKKSVQLIKTKSIFGFDYRINTMLEVLKDLPETAYEMLSDTRYRITHEETAKLKKNAKYVKSMLETLNNSYLPDAVHHGDLGAYNVRVLNKKCVFYDWGCGGTAHPFFDTVRLLSSMRDKLPPDASAKEIIINVYLNEWSEYGIYSELKNIFTVVDALLGFYMLYCKYTRTRNLHRFYAEKPDLISADGLGLDKRYETTAIYLKRFIEKDFK